VYNYDNFARVSPLVEAIGRTYKGTTKVITMKEAGNYIAVEG
jgi:hypothetical protein